MFLKHKNIIFAQLKNIVVPLNREGKFIEKKFVTNNKKIVIKILVLITILIAIVFIDFYLLPKTKTDDVITHYAVKTVQGKNGTLKEKVSYRFITKNGLHFSTQKKFIDEPNIEIKHTLLFKTITNVKSKLHDYSDNVTSGFNGIMFYCYLILLFSIGISLKILLSKKGCSENAFYNIICFNSFMIFVIAYMDLLF
ncbi:hypothetical protein PQ462_02640 [Flavobacterium sp. KACC 22758]|jgi:hypothetical protein|uniref:hypothetical protein n=1 Tax=Flavobacterium sp. KACC 22758 TaxID=3025667 RepID=UPI002365A5DC|nr:hypothetical protein [Flavobacterium sp. KACC 22758]WDF60276.1 hypothetical protein PQ462_02640 [Flavobacterium sp. KACC 22758]